MLSALKWGIIFSKQCVEVALHLGKLITVIADEQYTFRGSKILILWFLLKESKQTYHLKIFSSKDRDIWNADIVSQQKFLKRLTAGWKVPLLQEIGKERSEGHCIFSSTFDPALNCKVIARHVKKQYQQEA